ncbi:Hpt domain-containing protein [candidate division KSB1 bacterium]|nr:Hpt domain-containing protein [candidate division KSB1 bacterium]
MSINDLPFPITDALSRRFYGNVTFYKEMVLLFIRTGQENLEKIRTSVSQGDWETVQHLAHSLKGGASNVGAVDISSLADQLERLSMQSQPNGYDRLVGDLQRAFHSYEQISHKL